MDRLSWDDYFMQCAKHIASRATCSSRKVGALLVKDCRILATGYNGSPPGHPHCVDAGCLIEEETGRCIRTIHAEQNLIIQAARAGVSTIDSVIYTTHRPCHTCARIIAGAGVIKVISLTPIENDYSFEILKTSGIEYIYLPDKE